MKKLLERFFNPRKTPRMIQMENVECGAAAIGMILGYYKKFVPLQELREICGVTRDGLSMEEMKKTAEHYGLETEIYEADDDELEKLSEPVILFWEYDHFLVLEEIDGDRVLINDPRMGHRVISKQELQKGYSGLYMEFKVGPHFAPSGKRQNVLTRALEKILPFKKSLTFLLLVQVGIALLGLTAPVFAQIFIDEFFQIDIPGWDLDFLGIVLGVVVLTGMISWVQVYFLNFLQVRIAIRLSTQFIWRMLRLPILFFTHRYSSELVNRMNLNNLIGQILTKDLVLNTISLSLLSSYWVIMFFYNVSITLIALLVAIYNIALVFYIGKTRSNSYAKLQQSEARAVGISFDALEHIESMKGNANENFFFSRIASAYTRSINHTQEIGKKDVWLSNLSRFSSQLSTVFILAIGSLEVMNGSLTIGELIALQMLFNLFLTPVLQLVTFSTDVQSVEVDLTRLDDVLQATTDPILEERKQEAGTEKLSGELFFNQVNFGYKPLDPPFINHLNLQIQPGEMIGLTGGNGSGKSTLARLATCIFQPWTGEVLYDGKTYLEYTRNSLSSSMAIIDQIVQFFPGTIRDNLTLWNKDISEEEILRALEAACIKNDVEVLSLGLETMIEEDGRNFSGGQLQRLEIARVILKKPSILILDEATNSLDGGMEVQVLENIRSLGISTLLISHRLTTFKQCDRILVLDQGKIVQEGTHEALSKIEGIYQKLLEFEIKKKL